MYKRHKLELFRCRTIEAFNDQAREMGMSNVRLHFAALFLPDAGYWTDSKNHPLEYGRPLGFSTIFTLEEEMVFFSFRSVKLLVLNPYELNEFSQSNFPAKFEQNSSCTNCGK